MTSQFIVLIPADPAARLPQDRFEALESSHAEICGTAEVRLKDFGNRLQFIDCGDEFQATLCPLCGATTDLQWWAQRMDHAWNDDHGFHLCAFDMPCCGASARLDTLDYRPTQGFATWFLSARATGRGSLTSEEISRLETEAGTGLRVIYQSY